MDLNASYAVTGTTRILHNPYYSTYSMTHLNPPLPPRPGGDSEDAAYIKMNPAAAFEGEEKESDPIYDQVGPPQNWQDPVY